MRTGRHRSPLSRPVVMRVLTRSGPPEPDDLCAGEYHGDQTTSRGRRAPTNWPYLTLIETIRCPSRNHSLLALRLLLQQRNEAVPAGARVRCGGWSEPVG